MFGCLQWEMPGSDLSVFRFSASRYDSFQGMNLNQFSNSCAIKVFFLCTEHTGRLLGQLRWIHLNERNINRAEEVECRAAAPLLFANLQLAQLFQWLVFVYIVAPSQVNVLVFCEGCGGGKKKRQLKYVLRS